jgi:hypothetical protein
LKRSGHGQRALGSGVRSDSTLVWICQRRR